MSLFRKFQAWVRNKVNYKNPVRNQDWLESYNHQPAPVKDDLLDLNNVNRRG